VPNAIKYVLFLVVVLGVAYFGVKLGMKTETPISNHPPEEETLTSDLVTGTAFPDVTLLDMQGSPISTQTLLAGKGGLAVFMDFACPPCKEMIEKLQRAYTNDISDITIVGVAFAKPSDVAEYCQKTGITFPVYCDTSLVFVNKYMVMNFPLLVTVGKSGIIRDYTFDSRLPIEGDRIRKLIAE
jgi:peroxiredoxin